MECQKYANLERYPTRELNYIISPWTFATWGIDLMGMITQEKMIVFLTKYIITRFGVLQRLIMDNGQNFKGKDM